MIVDFLSHDLTQKVILLLLLSNRLHICRGMTLAEIIKFTCWATLGNRAGPPKIEVDFVTHCLGGVSGDVDIAAQPG